MISCFVSSTNWLSSTAKAGKEITESRLASTSLDVEARGSIELRIDWKGRKEVKSGTLANNLDYKTDSFSQKINVEEDHLGENLP